MKKNDLNDLLRGYSRNHLSPTQAEQKFIFALYESIKNAVGGSTIIVGSYARYTAIRPLHDLDILFIAGKFDSANIDPRQILNELQNSIKVNFKNPTHYQYEIKLQTHSVTVIFFENGEEIFSVDIVPAFVSGFKNEYGDDIYYVPEILRYGPSKRKIKYEEFNKNKKSELEWWIKSDPRGYIQAATDINKINSDFRKAVKIAKRWKHNCKEKFGEFKLKSFHIEQGIYELFKQNQKIEIADAIFHFFCGIPEFIAAPKIPDRADSTKFIDEYLNQLSSRERELIIQARDAFLINLENISQGTSVGDLLEANKRQRKSSLEEYLFDSRIPVYVDPKLSLKISGKVLQRTGGFREYFLDLMGKILVDRKIEFRISKNDTGAHLYKWKVKNDDKSAEPRGEITDHRTRNDPENSKFKGAHYVECYAIKDGVCIAKARQNVVLDA